jgi:hypothetical protein
VLARYKVFKGGEVKAINLTPANTRIRDHVMMTKEEADAGFVCLSITLHQFQLTWMIAKPKKDNIPGVIMVR